MGTPGGMPLSLPRSLPGSLRELTRRGVRYQTISASDAAEECLSHFSIEAEDDDDDDDDDDRDLIQPGREERPAERQAGSEVAVVHDHTGRDGATEGPRADFVHF